MKTGFTSDAPVALYMNTETDGKETSGTIISPGTKVSFYYSGISSVKLEGRKIPVDISESNCVSVSIPKGTYTIELLGHTNE